MRKTIASLALLAALAAPVTALAASIDASLIPDGTYTVKVERVVDSKHMQVAMDNGAETVLSATRASVDFSSLKPSDKVMLSLGKGQVLVYKKLG
ncbi:MAG TPA: hypothetical protein VIG32_02720 [Candidatus Baltobacteraceae bacterium]